MVNRHNQQDGQADSSRELPTGSRLGKYRIIGLLGRGGRGVVYRAEDTELQRTVALKIMSNASSDHSSVSEHLAEARMAAQLNHPNIISVHDAGTIDDHAFIAMELVAGPHLDELLSNGPLDVEQALDIVAQLCEGIKVAHQAGIIHRDIKPANVAMDNDGRVCLLDFGIASWQSIPGSDNSITGTVAYMAPEQFTSGTLTPATDLYALGVILYEMLTGEPPFKADYEAALIYSIVNHQPKNISDSVPDVSTRLDQMVTRLLSKLPTDRYQSAEELSADLSLLTGKDRASTTNSRASSSRGWKISLAAAFVVAATWLAFMITRDPDTSSSPTSPLKLAVLPFENQGLAEDEYFVNGVTDAISVQLSRLKGLRVIDRTSVSRLAAITGDSNNIAEVLDVQYLLSGAVYWEKSDQTNKVRVDAALTRVGDNTYLWANSYVYELEDVFTLQRELARQISGALRVRVSDRMFGNRIPTDNLEAYDLYLKGNEHFFRSWNQEDLTNAVHLYQQAVVLDENFALAHAMLSRGHESMYWEYVDRTETRCSLALASVERAMAIDPTLPEGRVALGYYYYHCEQDYERALREFQTVLADWPNNAELQGALGAIMRRVPGMLEDATLHFKTSVELDPSSHLNAFDVGLTYSMARQYDSALTYLDRALRLNPGWDLTYIYMAWLHIFQNGDIESARAVLQRAVGRADLNDSRYYWWLVRVTESDYEEVLRQTTPGHDTAEYHLHRAQLYWLMGQKSEELHCSDSAKTILERQLLERPDDARYLSYLSLAHARLGNSGAALELAAKAMEMLPASQDAFDGLFVLANSAETFMLLGLHNEAIEQLQYMLSIPGFASAPYLRADPLWQPLKGEPKFKQMLLAAEKANQ